MGGPAGPDSAFLVERELLRRKRFSAASEPLDRKPRTRRQSKSAKRFSQSRQNFIMDRCPLFSLSSFQIGHNLARFKSSRQFLRRTDGAFLFPDGSGGSFSRNESYR